MKNYINEMASGETLDKIRRTLRDGIELLEPYKVLLSDHEKKGRRSISTGREGYVRLISQIALANVNSLPREHDPAVLEQRLLYDVQLEETRQLLMILSEVVAETQLANSIDAMRMVDTFAASLQISRGNSAALDMAMREVDNYNHRYNRRPDHTDPPEEQPATPEA